MTISPTFLQKNLENSDDFLALNPLQKQFTLGLKNNGYFILKNFFDEEIINESANDLDNIKNNKILTKQKSYSNKIIDAYKYSNNLKYIASETNIVNLLTRAFGLKAFPFRTINYFDAEERKIHSDMLHFSAFPNLFFASCWVAFEDITLDKGPIEIVNKTHNLNYISKHDIYKLNKNKKINIKEYDSYHEEFAASFIKNNKLEITYLHLNKGDVLILAANLLNGRSKIVDENKSNKSQITYYFFKNCIYYDNYLSNISNNDINYIHPTDISTMEKTSFCTFLHNLKKNNRKLKLMSWATIFLIKNCIIRFFLKIKNKFNVNSIFSLVKSKKSRKS